MQKDCDLSGQRTDTVGSSVAVLLRELEVVTAKALDFKSESTTLRKELEKSSKTRAKTE